MPDLVLQAESPSQGGYILVGENKQYTSKQLKQAR